MLPLIEEYNIFMSVVLVFFLLRLNGLFEWENVIFYYTAEDEVWKLSKCKRELSNFT